VVRDISTQEIYALDVEYPQVLVSLETQAFGPSAAVTRNLLAAMKASRISAFLGAAPSQDDQFVIPSSGKLTAQDFTLLGKDGKARGRLYMRDNKAAIELYDAKGNVIWSAPPTSGIKPVQAQ
jgi:hypothetical protein